MLSGPLRVELQKVGFRHRVRLRNLVCFLLFSATLACALCTWGVVPATLGCSRLLREICNQRCCHILRKLASLVFNRWIQNHFRRSTRFASRQLVKSSFKSFTSFILSKTNLSHRDTGWIRCRVCSQAVDKMNLSRSDVLFQVNGECHTRLEQRCSETLLWLLNMIDTAYILCESPGPRWMIRGSRFSKDVLLDQWWLAWSDSSGLKNCLDAGTSISPPP